MILGKITGKVTTRTFTFEVSGDAKTLEYVKVYHPAYDYVLCQIAELTATTNATTALCTIIGYRKDDRVKQIRIPFEPGSEVLLADDEFIKHVIALPQNAAYIGKLDGKDIDVSLDVKKMITKHVSILAKSGAGKSYTVGVLLEEILEHKIPVLIIDPHGEHNTLKTPAQPSEQDQERMARYGITPKGYEVTEYNNHDNQIKLSNKLTRSELEHMLPKLNTTQQGLLYQAIRNSEKTDFDEILLALEGEEAMAKWSLINLIEGLKSHKLFSSEPTPPRALVKPGSATIINLKGYPPDIQQLITYKIAEDLYELRKAEKIPPFLLVLEEAHNFAPERSFGEAATSKTMRTLASEGRKFGLGLCVISQRPARVDKSVLSQCTTQIILKVTNPNDLKAVSNSVEGLTSETEKEIKNLPVGTALVTGVVDLPLIINIRPRRTAHGGDAADILQEFEYDEEDEDAELRPIIKPTITKRDLELMQDEPKTIETILKPATRLVCKEGDETYPIIIDRTRGEVLTSLDGTTKKLPSLKELGTQERRVLKHLFKHKRLDPKELSIADETIERLVSQGYITRASGDSYKLSNTYHYKKLKTASLATPIAYERVKGRALEERYTQEEAKRIVNKYARIIDEQECWIVQHITKE